MSASFQPLRLNAEMAQRFTGYLVGVLGAYATQRFDEQLASLALNRRSWGVLNTLDAIGPASQQRIGSQTNVDPSTMVATLDELERAQLVKRRRNPSDRRAHLVSITEKGRGTLQRARRIAGSAQRDLFAALSEEERATLHALLLKVAEAAADASPADDGGRGGAAASATPTASSTHVTGSSRKSA